MAVDLSRSIDPCQTMGSRQRRLIMASSAREAVRTEATKHGSAIVGKITVIADVTNCMTRLDGLTSPYARKIFRLLAMGSNHDAAPVSEYVREMAREHILQRGARFRESGARLRALINAGKARVIAYHRCVTVAAGLLANETRAELESLKRGAN